MAGRFFLRLLKKIFGRAPAGRAFRFKSSPRLADGAAGFPFQSLTHGQQAYAFFSNNCKADIFKFF
jgi:hypothetical protein